MEELEKLDMERKNCLYVAGELIELKHWLENGYKECEGRNVAEKIIYDEYLVLKHRAEELLELIMFKRKN